MKKHKTIMILPGDGIGHEVLTKSMRLFRTIENLTDYAFDFEEYPIGGACLATHGVPVTKETLARSNHVDAIVFGAVGDPAFDDNPMHLRPEYGLLALRKHIEAFCNVRPLLLYPELSDASAIKPHVLAGTDFIILRELTGGLYYGKPAYCTTVNGKQSAVNTMAYTEEEIRRIAVIAFQLAMKRRKKVTSVDKANVLEVSRLWRDVVHSVARDFPQVECCDMYVDNCAMQMLRDPRQFDVIVTENTFGDILSDEASMLSGSLGTLPSASIGTKVNMVEPVHGSAPDIAGKNIANPVGMLQSIAMMFTYSFGDTAVAAFIDASIRTVLAEGYHTPDLKLTHGKTVHTDQFIDLVCTEICKNFLKGREPCQTII